MLSRHYLLQVRKGEQGKGRSPLAVGLEMLKSPIMDIPQGLVNAFIAVVGLLPVGTPVILNNGDLAIVSDIEHLRGRSLYSQRPAPITKPRKIYVERMRTSAGQIVPERQARVCLGEDGESGEWAVKATAHSEGIDDLILRGLFRRPSTILTQIGIR